MDDPELKRFDFLSRGPCVPTQYVEDYYGLPWPLPGDLRQVFEAWQERLPKRPNCGAGRISRYELEAFMERKRVAPKKWLGARLGMRVESLDELLSRLKEVGMRPERYVAYADLIDESLSEDLVRSLPGLRFRTFSDHNSFCQGLHAELDKELGIKVQPLFCATADRLGESPRQFARDFECITLDPVSGKHQIWLDFRKPLTLGPDRCSKLFYVENRDALRPYCAGTQEPDGLEEYLEFLAGQQSG